MKQRIGRAILRMTRWKSEGTPPDHSKYVVIAAPHTSNWDLLYLLMFAWSHDMSISWLAKDNLFKPPLGWLLRPLGGIPVPRDRRTGLVDSIAERFASADELVVVIPPEGTRRYTDHWKSGFYRAAQAGGVPIVCVYLDYGSRTGGFGPIVWPSESTDADMAIFSDFYADKQGKFPENVSDVSLRSS